MRSKKRKSLGGQIIISILVIVLCFFLGVFLDGQLMVGEDGVPGHGMPFFTVVLPALAIFISVLRIFIYLIKRMLRDSRERKRNL